LAHVCDMFDIRRIPERSQVLRDAIPGVENILAVKLEYI